MPNVSPIPTTRVSDLYVRQRLLSQLQYDQRELTRIQSALTTGRRLSAPSDDAPAALRAINLQGLIERKVQVRTNLTTNQSYLSASDNAISSVTTQLISVRGTAITMSDSTSSDEQRQAAVDEVNRILQQLTDAGNQQFRGRYLFGGTRTYAPPFRLDGGLVHYEGDEGELLSYSDLDVLFETNVPGHKVFGALSERVRGMTDLNPVVSPETPIAALRGGQGITAGSIEISDGLNRRVIDLSHAATLGDVARLLVAQPPAGRTVTARVSSYGLTVQLDAAGGGNLTINEVGGGTTATELGIRNTVGTGIGQLTGGDLNPRLTSTTRLDDLLGVRSRSLLPALGAANDLIIEANQVGAAWDGVTISLLDDSKLQAAPGLTAGNEVVSYSATPVAARAAIRLVGANNDLILTAGAAGTALNGVAIDFVNGGNLGDAATVSYNGTTRRLTIGIDDSDETSTDALIAAVNGQGTFSATRDPSAEPNTVGGVVLTSSAALNLSNTYNSGADAKTLQIRIQTGVSTAKQVLAKINAEGTFRASFDLGEPNSDGSGALLDTYVNPAATAVTSGGGGTPLDQAAGLLIKNGGASHLISFTGAATIEDLLNTLNGSAAGVLATINAQGTGIDLRTRISGTDFSIGENGGTTAAQLGLRTLHGGTPLSELNSGRGVQALDGDDFIIHRKDGVEFTVDLAGAVTVGDVLSLINNDPGNLIGGVPVVARLALVGNGIELVNDGPPGSGTLSVREVGFNQVARDLGLIPSGVYASAPPTPGVVASGRVLSAGPDNDLVFSATGPGTLVNNVQVLFVNTGLGAGNETVAYDAGARTLTFDVDATTTANRVISLLAGDPLAGAMFQATLDTSDGTPNQGTGVVQIGAAAVIGTGVAEQLTGSDVNPQEVHGTYAALIRLRDAFDTNDRLAIERGVALLDEALQTVNFARSELGARQQGLDILQTRLDDEEIELQAALSLDLDVDLVAAISEFTARQASFEAALRTTGAISQLTLLDFL